MYQELILEPLTRFLQAGGPILGLIFLSCIVLLSLVMERYWFIKSVFPRIKKRTLEQWHEREDKTSKFALYVRELRLSQTKLSLEQGLSFIKTLVAISPFLGLLGTVTGMIEVFDVISILGSSSPRPMADGISKATIPTMAGLAISIVGLFFINRLTRLVKVEQDKLADQMS